MDFKPPFEGICRVLRVLVVPRSWVADGFGENKTNRERVCDTQQSQVVGLKLKRAALII
jgi:hypothetical protein